MHVHVGVCSGVAMVLQKYMYMYATHWEISNQNLNDHYRVAGTPHERPTSFNNPFSVYDGYKCQSLKVVVLGDPSSGNTSGRAILSFAGEHSQGQTIEIRTVPGTSQVRNISRQQYPLLQLFQPYNRRTSATNAVLELSAFRCAITLRFSMAMLTPDWPATSNPQMAFSPAWEVFKRIAANILPSSGVTALSIATKLFVDSLGPVSAPFQSNEAPADLPPTIGALVGTLTDELPPELLELGEDETV